MILEQLLEGLETVAVTGPDTALRTDISDCAYDDLPTPPEDPGG